MPTPSQIRSSQINTELGVGSTTTLRLGNNWTRNLTTQTTGSVTYGKARWGINFPGGFVGITIANGGQYVKTYGGGLTFLPNTTLHIFADDFGFSFASSNTVLALYSNGVMKIEAVTSTQGSFSRHVTWLTSGSSSQYTAQLRVYDAIAVGGDSINTDLSLSTSRIWSSAALSGGGRATNYANCGLIIKSTTLGTTLIERPVYFDSAAEAGGF